MSLQNDIETQLTQAMKAKDAPTVSALRMLRSALKNLAIEKAAKELSDEQVVEVVGREVKKLRDSLADFEKAGRDDLAAPARNEIAILSKFLPQQLSEDEIRTIVRERASALGLSGEAAYGRLMGEAMKALKGRADGNAVGRVVKETLQAP
jgi:uncharacterized protein YqeY